MKKLLLTSLACLVAIAGCKTSPTGRTQMMMYSEANMNQMGAQSFNDMKKKMTINTDEKTNRYVRCISDNVIAVLPKKYANQQWEVVVFEEPSANAFALPGGKIGVHTGLLKIAVNQDQLAAVIGHEVGHVIAQHSNERASQSAGVQLLMQASNVASQAANNKYHNELMAVLGLGAQYGVQMPFSRIHESEADEIGLELMAKSGFNPKESVTLWQRMSAQGSSGTPEFLSTHPSPETRIDDLRKLMPEAMKLNKSALAQNRIPNCKL